ncbi:hypothetical protein [Chryseobacterium vrystaatense]|uniref:Uncharacterized protein n=1 Tax=Chryseobacterium vrystaatense TaxID=307480 RepID=A0A1M4WVG1_9FLAO|nr:hypothetical protein [Chryseobacterium vrystaatense]SHE85281.1 hypothetical protein SAMN02787073_1264 [Chryseobacterium vrystaatense]
MISHEENKIYCAWQKYFSDLVFIRDITFNLLPDHKSRTSDGLRVLLCHLAAVVNLLVLLYELMEFLTHTADKKTSGNSVLLLLVNIPIAILYMGILIDFKL